MVKVPTALANYLQFPEPTWWLATPWNSSSREADTLFWLLQALWMHNVLIDTQAKQTHRIIFKIIINNIFKDIVRDKLALKLFINN